MSWSHPPPKACPRQLATYPTPFGIGVGMSYAELTHSLTDAFNTLADEAQGLNDRRIVLEHKLRFAHEQVSDTFCVSCFLSPSSELVAEPSRSRRLPNLPHVFCPLDWTAKRRLRQRPGTTLAPKPETLWDHHRHGELQDA